MGKHIKSNEPVPAVLIVLTDVGGFYQREEGALVVPTIY